MASLTFILILITLLLFFLPLSTSRTTLTFQVGKTASFQVDFCEIAPCSGRQEQWEWFDKYVCVSYPYYDSDSSFDSSDSECAFWSDVFANTGPNDWGYNPWQATQYGLKTRFSIIKGHAPHDCAENYCNPLIITLKDPSLQDSGTYVLAAYASGSDPLGFFQIKVTDNSYATNTGQLAGQLSSTFPPDSQQTLVKIMNISTLSSTFSIETGYGDQNRWLQWVLYSAKQTFQVNSTSFDPTLSFFLLTQTTPRADIWWMCRTPLLDILPPEWIGTCALVQLVMPFRLLPLKSPRVMSAPDRRRKPRSVDPSTFSLHDPGVYIDSIGVPRGVPDEFKARDQVAAGFESIFPIVTINKNVDWINYLYYNQQRFLNFTKEAVEGIHEQLDRTSLMTWQNRLALDMLLAEKGGVCAMFGDACCTYIPNNTAPDGSITRALAGLTALSNELATNSGISNPWDKWFMSTFGSWGQWLRSVFISLAVAFLILLLVACCIVPLIRYIVERVTHTSIFISAATAETKHGVNRKFKLSL
ncbi:LOW QUALITY PROTEIN: uncharacterized protein LOC127529022 [Erpetoichthys calabaricus]|uniref:LOW QUALITY PROTEIN: uncharacterized protein LOC127529022 n=1 Tax=Erpetoichthys calabaricus TaxID=27687 RepID=UPI0022343534|nr:LOW QUALITY PROTEIN: uncharacterized protein LOC127529022 [Erpetoichthys calabaricus]